MTSKRPVIHAGEERVSPTLPNLKPLCGQQGKHGMPVPNVRSISEFKAGLDFGKCKKCKVIVDNRQSS